MLVSVEFARWEKQNITFIVGVPLLCNGPGAGPAPQEGDQHWNRVAIKHKDIKDWRGLKSHCYVVQERGGSLACGNSSFLKNVLEGVQWVLQTGGVHGGV